MKHIPLLLISLLIMSFSQCSDKLILESHAPLELDEVYYIKWVAGEKNGGSGINLFIPIKSNKNKIVLDSLYFMDKTAKLEQINDTLVVGRFKTATNKPSDIIISNEPYAEYGNKAPKLPKKLTFVVKNNECIISYKSGKKIRYFRVPNIYEKKTEYNIRLQT